jgi:hypothetical protein
MKSNNFKRNDFTRYVLKTIEEEHYMKSGMAKGVVNLGELDIEHIAPEQSFSASKYSPWQRYLDCDEEEFDEYRKRIGNLTLLESRVNKRASDNPYEQKRQIYGDDTDFAMAQEIANEYDQWRIQQIEERSEKLAEITCQIWSIDNA